MGGYADDHTAVIETLDLHDATLVGHSTGGAAWASRVNPPLEWGIFRMA